ncbi:MAG TPA: type II toxin-antitoxin system YoeB family toxin [Streptosporangiaceae bacterium]|nr:type II toxin-antitoxin system YoeB family toxin [Streptosporangiaceae bacterium]
MRLVFEDQGWEDYTSWLKTDRKMLARINKLIGDVRRDPFTGISKVPGTGPLSGAYAGRRSLLSVNDRESPRFTVRSGGQRARY